MLIQGRQNSKQKGFFGLGMLTSALLGILVTSVVSFFAPAIARAISIDSGLGATLGLGTADLLSVVINIVQWALGLLGLAAVVIIMYGGFIWMTANGNQEKIAKAKKILINGLIGLAIVLLSWAIVFFVMRTIDDATGGSGGTSCGTIDCAAGQTCCAPNMCAISCGASLPTNLTLQDFEVSRDASDEVYQCSRVKARFNANIDPATVDAAEIPDNLRTQDIVAGNPFASTDDFVTAGNTVTYRHDTLFPTNTDYQEWYPTVGTPVQDYDPRIISLCTAIGCTGPDPWVWDFHVGLENDEVAPEIISSYPINTADAGYPDRNVSRAPVINLTFNEPIDDSTIIGAGARPNGNFELWECTDNTCSSFVGQYSNSNLLTQSIPNGINVYIEQPFLNPLNAFTWYQVRVHDVEDLCGNPMAVPEVWNFQTNDSVPGIQSWYPTGTNECPDTDIYVTFGTSMYYEMVMLEINNGTDIRNIILSPSGVWPAPVEEVVAGVGTFKVMDAALPISNNFKVFKFEPDPSLDANSHYNVDITTTMVINTDGSPLIHHWEFDVSDPANCTCSPYVSSLSPSQGPRESCLTVQGSCFTGTLANPATPTNLVFNDGTDIANGVIGGYDANYITTTLPAVYDDGDRPRAQAEITYTNPSYGVLSSAAYPGGPEFFVNSSSVSDGPCLWSINPNSGYESSNMSASGIRFGATQGAGHIAYNGLSSPATSWNDTNINTSVPTGALDGNVTVTNNGGQESNGIYFDVLHVPPGTPYVITNNFCDASTLSSPSPWPEYQEVCLNANFSARFNEPMSVGTITNSANVYFEQCNDSTCSTVVPGHVSGALTAPSSDTFIFNPTVYLTVNTWYRGTITTGVQNASGVNMVNPFVWKFKTQVDNTVCQIESYNLTADRYLITNANPAARFTNLPIGPNCQILAYTDYNWYAGWSNPPLPAGIARIGSTGPQTNQANYTYLATGVDGTVTVNSSAAGTSIPPAARQLTVDRTFCQDDADCSSCPGSVCMLSPTPHCSPVIQSINPISAPVGNFVTIAGCMFGTYTGSANVEFTGTPWVNAIFPAICGPAGSTWTDDSVVVEVPNEDTADTSDDAISGPIRLTNQYGNTTTLSGFTIGGPSTPNLCYLDPSDGKQGETDATAAVGEGFGTSGNVSFLNDAGGRSTWSGILTDWSDTLVEGIDIPSNAVSSIGSNGVTVNGSNPVNFYVTCADNTECSTGCCYAGQCSDSAMCSGGLPGDLCQISSHPNCSLGPIYPPSGYECISNTGELPMDAIAGDDCRFCCRPGDTYNGLTCMVNQGDCLGGANDRGLYCGCTTDAQCGDPANIGCGDMGGGTMCCSSRPNVVSINPYDGETDVCMNRGIVVEFDQIMDEGSVTDLGVFTVTDDSTSLLIDGTLTSYFSDDHTIFQFSPDLPWPASHSFTITINARAANQYFIGMSSDYVSHFTAGDTLCNIDHVKVDIQYMPGPTTTYNASQDMYTCKRNDCADDMTSVINGNQHRYIASAVDASGNYLLTGATYDWSGSSTNGVLNVESPNNRFTHVGTLGLDGTEQIRADVDLGAAGSGSAIVNARVESCDNPWPNNPNYMYPAGVSVIEPQNFTTYYCRDGGLPGMANPIINVNHTPTINGVDELLREVFFSTCDSDVASCTSANTSGDVIGIRVMENQSFLSPSAWFNQMFPEDTGSCVPINAVDGYQACRAGRTIYVAATNLAGTTLWPNIYLVSYNDSANGQTVNIYNQMVENWFFNSAPASLMNVCALAPGDTNKECIVRDTKRVTDLGEIGYLLLNYQFNNGDFPELAAGTFLPGLTSSKWPSWMAEFGNAIGMNPPLDPINEFNNPTVNCAVPPYDPAGTCWNDTAHTFNCPTGSHTYAYLKESTNAYLFTNLEYVGTGGFNTSAWPGRFFGLDACMGYTGSNCPCFNYSAEATDNFWITNWSPPS
ncbi:MAG: Ig-like domain-containing protein [Patescibacteria group bacterium]